LELRHRHEKKWRCPTTQHRQIEEARGKKSLSLLKKLLHIHKDEHRRWEDAQKSTADDFNLFRVLDIEHKELIHSKLLAWLLDPRIEHGNHAQGNLGFRLFLEEFQPELDPTAKLQIERYAHGKYRVRREVSSDESRVDIEVVESGKFIIHIENKILSLEGDVQTKREWRDLNKRAEPNHHAIFLTLDGRKADEEKFRPVGWSRIARVLDNFAEKAQPPVVKLFARHYAEALRKLVGSQVIASEIPYVETDI
jgi:hypothetical protein